MIVWLFSFFYSFAFLYYLIAHQEHKTNAQRNKPHKRISICVTGASIVIVCVSLMTTKLLNHTGFFLVFVAFFFSSFHLIICVWFLSLQCVCSAVSYRYPIPTYLSLHNKIKYRMEFCLQLYTCRCCEPPLLFTNIHKTLTTSRNAHTTKQTNKQKTHYPRNIDKKCIYTHQKKKLNNTSQQKGNFLHFTRKKRRKKAKRKKLKKATKEKEKHSYK